MIAKKKGMNKYDIKKLKLDKQAFEKTMADKENEYARTKQVFQSRAEDLGDFMQRVESLEKKASYCWINIHRTPNLCQDVSNQKEMLDNLKNQSLLP